MILSGCVITDSSDHDDIGPEMLDIFEQYKLFVQTVVDLGLHTKLDDKPLLDVSVVFVPRSAFPLLNSDELHTIGQRNKLCSRLQAFSSDKDLDATSRRLAIGSSDRNKAGMRRVVIKRKTGRTHRNAGKAESQG